MRHNSVEVIGEPLSYLPKTKRVWITLYLEAWCFVRLAFLGRESKPYSESTTNKSAWSGTDESWVQPRGKENKRETDGDQQRSRVQMSHSVILGSRDPLPAEWEPAPESSCPLHQGTPLNGVFQRRESGVHRK